MPAILIARRQMALCWMSTTDTDRRYSTRIRHRRSLEISLYFLQNGTLVAVNSNGQQVWSFAGDGALQSAPFVVNQTIYIGSRFGMLYGLNASGQLIWITQVGESIPTPEQPRCFGNWSRSGRGPLDCADRKHPRRLRKLRKRKSGNRFCFSGSSINRKPRRDF